jgi:hypothetical protein
MKKRHSTEQIIRILKEVEASGLKESDACLLPFNNTL